MLIYIIQKITFPVNDKSVIAGDAQQDGITVERKNDLEKIKPQTDKYSDTQKDTETKNQIDTQLQKQSYSAKGINKDTIKQADTRKLIDSKEYTEARTNSPTKTETKTETKPETKTETMTEPNTETNTEREIAKEKNKGVWRMLVDSEMKTEMALFSLSIGTTYVVYVAYFTILVHFYTFFVSFLFCLCLIKNVYMINKSIQTFYRFCDFSSLNSVHSINQLSHTLV